ncbi:hypothetical protein Csa_017653 [Cucumis sativus]|nr:hypothetical protein Csa_017653 [Cucumis sativus]
MEANKRKLRGFMRGKLMPFYKQYNGSKTKQTGLDDPGRDTTATRDSLSQFDRSYGIIADEGVDVKAANYISSTLARFKSLNELPHPIELSSIPLPHQ